MKQSGKAQYKKVDNTLKTLGFKKKKAFIANVMSKYMSCYL